MATINSHSQRLFFLQRTSYCCVYDHLVIVHATRLEAGNDAQRNLLCISSHPFEARLWSKEKTQIIFYVRNVAWSSFYDN